MARRRPTGIMRHLDELGRIVLPPEVRDAFRPRRDQEFAFAGDGESPPRPRVPCVFCGATTHVIRHRGKGICVDCVREIRQLVSGSE